MRYAGRSGTQKTTQRRQNEIATRTRVRLGCPPRGKQIIATVARQNLKTCKKDSWRWCSLRTTNIRKMLPRDSWECPAWYLRAAACIVHRSTLQVSYHLRPRGTRQAKSAQETQKRTRSKMKERYSPGKRRKRHFGRRKQGN